MFIYECSQCPASARLLGHKFVVAGVWGLQSASEYQTFRSGLNGSLAAAVSHTGFTSVALSGRNAGPQCLWSIHKTAMTSLFRPTPMACWRRTTRNASKNIWKALSTHMRLRLHIHSLFGSPFQSTDCRTQGWFKATHLFTSIFFFYVSLDHKK